MKNEAHIAYQIRQHLNRSAQQLDEDIAARLEQARVRALSRQKAAVGAAALAASGNIDLPVRLGASRAALWLGAVLLAALLVIGGDYGYRQYELSQIEEIDAALLTDELPLDAYLNKDFNTWLKHSDVH